MGFEDINNAVRAKGGSFVNLKNKGDKVAGTIVAEPEIRNQTFKEKVVTYQSGPNKGEPRKSWVFTLETADGAIVKVECKEGAQWAITGALNGRKIALNGQLSLEVVEEAVRGEKGAQFKAYYVDPTFESPFQPDAPAGDNGSPFETDEPPY